MQRTQRWLLLVALLGGVAACTSDLGTGPGLAHVKHCNVVARDSVAIDSAAGWWAQVTYEKCVGGV